MTPPPAPRALSLGIYFGYNIIGATAPVLQAPPYSLDAKAIGALAAACAPPPGDLPRGLPGEGDSRHVRPVYTPVL